MIRVPITKGYFAVIDDADYDLVSVRSWYATISGDRVYADARIKLPDGSKKTFRMHRVIMNAAPHETVDHRDGDGLNNRRENLRICTATENKRNRRVSSWRRFKGVSFVPGCGRPRASICFNKKQIRLGRFDTEEEAAIAYDSAARHYFGEFALCNFPRDEPVAKILADRIGDRP